MGLNRHAAALAAVLLAALPARAQQRPPAAPPAIDQALAPYASLADSVKLADGRLLHIVCMGQGSPTVILSAGLGDWSGSAWSRVQGAIARTTRVCSWDRPGFGLSDGTASGRTTSATIAADLAAALSRGRIAGPYVMVSHSMGSYETLLFTDANRDKVVGMVLVDPSIPDQVAMQRRLREQFHLPEPRPSPFVATWRQCAINVGRGALKAGDDLGPCLNLPPSLPPALSAALAAKVTSSPVQFQTAASFMADGPREGSALTVNPRRDYGDMPLVVLSSDPPTPPGMSEADLAVLEASKAETRRAHDALAALSRRGWNTVVPGVGHYIQGERPQVVIVAVEAVVREARGEK